MFYSLLLFTQHLIVPSCDLLNYQCPYEIPGVIEINNTYVINKITICFCCDGMVSLACHFLFNALHTFLALLPERTRPTHTLPQQVHEAGAGDVTGLSDTPSHLHSQVEVEDGDEEEAHIETEAVSQCSSILT